MTDIWNPRPAETPLSTDDASLVEALLPPEFMGARNPFTRVCDFTSGKRDVAEDVFKTVDTSRAVTAPGAPRGRVMAPATGTRGGRYPQQQPLRDPKSGRLLPQAQQLARMQPTVQAPGTGPRQQQTGRQSQYYQQQPTVQREWSIPLKSEWEMLREIPLIQLSKLTVDLDQIKAEDLVWCGELRDFDKTFDRVIAKTGGKDLKKADGTSFYNVTSAQDQVLEQLLQRTVAATAGAADGPITVACTDKILSVLMAASRSVNSWDLVVTRVGNAILFDKRDGSPVDLLTVNETAVDAPTDEVPAEGHALINTATRLAHEATMLNHNFSQQVLSATGDAESLQYPNPFADEGEKVASGAYRYRKVLLPSKAAGAAGKDLVVLIRTEVNAKQESPEGKRYLLARALNEYSGNAGSSWRNRIDAQRGSILGTEIKNNSFKFGRWVAEASLADCDTLKLGYVSRKRNEDAWSHSLLNVQTLKTAEIAQQIGFSMSNAWGVVYAIVDLILSQPAEDTGRYLVIRDPKKSALRLYQVPWEEFEGIDANDEEEGEEED